MAGLVWAFCVTGSNFLRSLPFQVAWLLKMLVAIGIVSLSFFLLSNAHAASSDQSLDHLSSGSQLPEKQKGLISVAEDHCPNDAGWTWALFDPMIACFLGSDLDQVTLVQLEVITNNSELTNVQMLMSYLETFEEAQDTLFVKVMMPSDQVGGNDLLLIAGRGRVRVAIPGIFEFVYEWGDLAWFQTFFENHMAS